MSMYDMFMTDETLEKKGVVLDYGDFRITIARAGGGNKKYEKILQFKSKPFRRAIESESMDSDHQMRILQECYMETVILNWEVKRDDKWVIGIDPPMGEPKEGVSNFDRKNMERAFRDMPDLFLDIHQQAQKATLFKADLEEVEIKN